MNNECFVYLMEGYRPERISSNALSALQPSSMVDVQWHKVGDNWYAADATGEIVGHVMKTGDTWTTSYHGDKGTHWLFEEGAKRAVEDGLRNSGYTVVRKKPSGSSVDTP